MRVFENARTEEWEAVVGRESWGAFFLIFLPRGRKESPRQALLDAGSMEDAMKALATMTDQELRNALERSEVKTMD